MVRGQHDVGSAFAENLMHDAGPLGPSHTWSRVKPPVQPSSTCAVGWRCYWPNAARVAAAVALMYPGSMQSHQPSSPLGWSPLATDRR